MSSDPNKKSGRTFQCRDVLWETFEQMARELECSVDYLINEAMKQYARQRSYGGTRPQFPSSPTRDSAPVPSDRSGGYPPPPPPPRAGGLPPPPARPARQAPGPLPPPPGRGPGMQQHGGPQHGGPQHGGQQHGGQQHGGQQHGGLPAPPPRGPSAQMPAVPRSVPPPGRSVPPPIPRGGVPGAMGGGGMPSPMGMASNGYPPSHGAHGGSPQLCVMYQGEKIPVNKERFVIGRGKQSSDLTLKDPNVSRQHAMIEFQNGIYFMVDMGSTNGVEFNGQRIARKQIAEGDHFKICDHDLRFTYR